MIVRLSLPVLICFVNCFTAPQDTTALDHLVNNALAVARAQTLAMALSLEHQPGRLPKTLTPEGTLESCGPEWWTSGFFPGVLWYLLHSMPIFRKGLRYDR